MQTKTWHEPKIRSFATNPERAADWPAGWLACSKPATQRLHSKRELVGGVKKFWRDLWRREAQFMSAGKRDLRHGLSSVGVSTLATQFYCEFKVENEFRFGEIPTEAKQDGTEQHDALIPTEEITRERFVELVSRKEPSYATLSVWGMLGDLRLLGQPDHIIWSKEKPVWLVELKTTSGDPMPLWDDQLYQILIYAALLEKMGFDCSRLNLALIRLRAREISDQEKRAWIARISDHLEKGKVAKLEAKLDGLMKVHLIRHDTGAAEAAVRLKQGYWLGQREPASSLSVGRCRACEYHTMCEKSLYKESGPSMALRSSAGGGEKFQGREPGRERRA